MKKKWLSKFFSVILSAMLVLSIVPVATVSADSTTHIYTFGYEEAYSIFGDQCQRSQTQVHSGEYALEMNTDLDWKAIQAPLLNESPLGNWWEYVVDFWIYFDSSFDLSRLSQNLKVYSYDGTRWVSGEEQSGAEIMVNENFLGHWNHVSAHFTNKSGNVAPYLYIMGISSGFGGKAYIDDVTITSISYGTYEHGYAQTLVDGYFDDANNDLIVPTVAGGTIPAPGTRGGYTFEGWYTENTYENRVTTYLAGNNTYYANWEYTEIYTYGYEDAYSVYSTKVARSQDVVHSGEYSLALNTDAGWNVIQAPLYDGDAAGSWHTLVIDFWMYIDSGFDLTKLTDPMKVYTFTSSYLGNGVTPVSEKGSIFSINEDCLGHWNHISVTFYNNVSKKVPYLYIQSVDAGPGFGGKVYIDDVTVTSVSLGTYGGGAARVLKDAHHDRANNDIIVPSVTGGTIPTPTRDGFTFEGWYTENSHENRVTTYLAGVNTYYAKWRGTVWDGTTASSYDGGTGTAANPYRIATGAQLSKLCGSSGGATNGQYFILTDDIMLNDTSSPDWRNSARGWKSTSNYLEYDFSGTFDGNGHVISGIYINDSRDNRMGGLFPSLRNTATVKNLGIVNSSITMTGANSFAGAIAGATDGNFTVTNCFVASSVDISAVHTAAGLIGKVDSNSAKTADVENCYSLAELNSPSDNYGLFGYSWQNYTGTVANNYTVGYDVFCNNANYGGFYSGASNNYSSVKVHNDHVHTVVTRTNMLGDAAQSSMSGLDYTNIWGTAEGKYPYLKAFGSRYAENAVLPQDYKSHSLILAEEIGVNFYVDLSGLTTEEKAGSYMTFEIENDKLDPCPYDSEKVNGSGQYRFTCYVSSVQMADAITPVYHFGDGKTITGSSYCVKDYIDYVAGHTSQYTPNVVTLVKALGDYGHYAQIYLDGLHSNSHTTMTKYRAADYTASELSTYLSELNAKGVAIEKSDTDATITKLAYNLNFDSTTNVNVKVTTASAVSATVDGDAAEVIAPDKSKGENFYTVRISGLMITEIGEAHTVTGTAGGSSFTVSNISGLSYIRAILNKAGGSAASKNAMAAFYEYYKAAQNYVNPDGGDSGVDGEGIDE